MKKLCQKNKHNFRVINHFKAIDGNWHIVRTCNNCNEPDMVIQNEDEMIWGEFAYLLEPPK